MLVTASRIENGVSGEDRAVVRRDGDRLLIVVADGAGGTSSGGTAAQAVCDAILGAPRTGSPWDATLRDVDQLLVRSNRGGQSTGVVVEVVGHVLRGASVGDSGAWLIASDQTVDLTANQPRKPLLGSGNAQPTSFGPTTFQGRLLVASDGLLKYLRRFEIVRRATLGSLDHGVRLLVEAVRLRSGAFQDDVAVVLAEDAAEGNSIER
jgi:stage II sporulation SpoE-like protein